MAHEHSRGAGRPAFCLAALAALVLFIFAGTGPVLAQDRTLTFKQIHTGETLTVTYMRNGRHDPEAMRRINHIMRDWRRNEVAQIDPHLLDILWEVRRATGSTAPVQVLSAYRSPVTNAALRQRSSGVAQNSQHTVGRALDFRLPDVPVQKLRETAMKFQAGGVGFYPGSGFVHIDTGSVRSWPRLSRQQLANLFPDGKTVHLPSDGTPLAGYEQAKAEAARGTLSRIARAGQSSGRQQTARGDSGDPSRPLMASSSSSNSGRGLLAGLFRGRGQQEQPASSPTPPEPAVASQQQPEAAPATARPEAAAVELAEAPIPTPRPADEQPARAGTSLSAAPLPPARPAATAGLAVAAVPRERPAIRESSETDDISTGAIDAVMALAPSRHFDEDLPFAETFNNGSEARSSGTGVVALPSSRRAIRPYITSASALRTPELASLRHPDQSDISLMLAESVRFGENRFARREIHLELSGFSGGTSPTDAANGEGGSEASEPSTLARLWSFLTGS